MLLKDYTDAQLRGGVGLSRVRTRYEVRIAGKIAGYTDDPHYGLAFAREAKERGMDAGMFTIDTADLVRTKGEGE